MGDDLWMARYLLHRVAEVHLEHGDSLDRNDLTKMLNQIEQLLKMCPRISFGQMYSTRALRRRVTLVIFQRNSDHVRSLDQYYHLEPVDNVTRNFMAKMDFQVSILGFNFEYCFS